MLLKMFLVARSRGGQSRGWEEGDELLMYCIWLKNDREDGS